MRDRLKVVVVDDERLARDELRFLLSSHPAVDWVGEAASVDQALDVFREERPDLAFVDVQLRGEAGYDLIGRMESTVRIVFTTGFSEMDIKRLHSLGHLYLLKPVNPETLSRLIDRLTSRRRAPDRSNHYTPKA